jgi:hypothetical protein
MHESREEPRTSRTRQRSRNISNTNELQTDSIHSCSARVEFIDENGGGPWRAATKVAPEER